MMKGIRTALAVLLGISVGIAAPVAAATPRPMPDTPGHVALTVATRTEPALPHPVLPHAAACVAPTVTTVSAWSSMWTNGVPGTGSTQRWVSSDGGWSVKHPTDCSYLFLYGDTAIIKSDGQRAIPHSSAIRWSSTGLKYVSGDTSLIPDSPDGTVDWAGPAVVDKGLLYVFTVHIRPKAGGWDDFGHDLAQFAWPANGAPVFQGKWTTPGTGKPAQGTKPDGSPDYHIQWGAGVFAAADYIYIYGSYRENGWFAHQVYVARVPVGGNLTNYAKWQYWNGATWDVNDYSNAAVIMEAHNGPEGSFSVAFAGGKYHMMSKRDGTFSNTVVEWTSPNPYGPWTENVKFTVPYTDADRTYLPIEHWSLPRLSNGQVLTSYSNQAGCVPSAADPTVCSVDADGHPVPTQFDDLWSHPQWFRNSWVGVTPS